jgi:nitrite reductase/ring-hydroxylating ferredoxin subunit
VSSSLNNTGNGHGIDAARALARLADIDDGGFAEADAELDAESVSLILHRDGDRVRAWRNVCPHAGRRLDWSPGRFLKSKDGLLVCAVHGASFETVEGVCVAGPCRGDRLQAVAVRVVDDVVTLADGDVAIDAASGCDISTAG